MTYEVKNDDLVLVMSDGVSDNLTDRQIEQILETIMSDRRFQTDTNLVTRQLLLAAQKISRANELRSKMDDMSLITIKVGTEQGNDGENQRKSFGAAEATDKNIPSQAEQLSKLVTSIRNLNEFNRFIDFLDREKILWPDSSGVPTYSAEDLKRRSQQAIAYYQKNGRDINGSLRFIPRAYNLRETLGIIMRSEVVANF